MRTADRAPGLVSDATAGTEQNADKIRPGDGAGVGYRAGGAENINADLITADRAPGLVGDAAAVKEVDAVGTTADRAPGLVGDAAAGLEENALDVRPGDAAGVGHRAGAAENSNADLITADRADRALVGDAAAGAEVNAVLIRPGDAAGVGHRARRAEIDATSCACHSAVVGQRPRHGVVAIDRVPGGGVQRGAGIDDEGILGGVEIVGRGLIADNGLRARPACERNPERECCRRKRQARGVAQQLRPHRAEQGRALCRYCPGADALSIKPAATENHQ